MTIKTNGYSYVQMQLHTVAAFALRLIVAFLSNHLCRRCSFVAFKSAGLFRVQDWHGMDDQLVKVVLNND